MKKMSLGPVSDIVLEELLARGVYKEVYRVRVNNQEAVLACPSAENSYSRHFLWQEIDLYTKLPPHPGLVGYLGYGRGAIVRPRSGRWRAGQAEVEAGDRAFFYFAGKKKTPGGPVKKSETAPGEPGEAEGLPELSLSPFLLLESLDGDMGEVISLYSAALVAADNGPALKSVWAALVDAMLQIVEGTIHLENHRILHLDLKPSNILLSVRQARDTNLKGQQYPGEDIRPIFKLADLGICEELLPEEEWAESGSVGSALYAAPEVCSQGRACFRSPVYSCGVIFSHLLLGKHPYDSEKGAKEAAKGKFRLDLRPVSHLLPRPLVSLVRRMTHPDPFARPDFLEVRRVLRSLDESLNLSE